MYRTEVAINRFLFELHERQAAPSCLKTKVGISPEEFRAFVEALGAKDQETIRCRFRAGDWAYDIVPVEGLNGYEVAIIRNDPGLDKGPSSTD